jgi:hypothetical protein
VGLLLAGGLLLLLLQRQLSPRLQRVLPIGLVAVSMTGWLLLRLQPQGAGQWWLWQAPLGLESALGLQWPGTVWLAGWLLFMVALVALILPGWQPRPGFTPLAFWMPLLLASGLLVLSAATWSVLLASWLLMLFMTGLLAGTPIENAARAWTFLLLSSLFLLAVPMFNGMDSFLATLDSDYLNLQAQLLLTLAAMIPLGLYPFHVWLTPETQRPRSIQLALHLIPALAAVHLLGRFELSLLGSLSWVSVGIAGLLGSALAAWATQDAQRAWLYVFINRASWVMLALALSQESGAHRTLFPLATLALIGMLWALLSTRNAQSGVSWRNALLLFFLIGFPLTPGFSLNLALTQLASTVVSFPAWILTLLAQTLLVAAILGGQAQHRETQQEDFLPAGSRMWLLTLVLAFTLWWGVFPDALAHTAGMMPAHAHASVGAQLQAINKLSGGLTLLLPLLMGWLLARARNHLFAGQEVLQTKVAAIAELDWLLRWSRNLFHYLAQALGFLSDILDGAGQFGWVLLALLILWLFQH